MDDDEDNWEYRPMTQTFYSKMWWLWIVQGVAYVIVIILLQFVLTGKELAFAIYIPLDFCIFLAMAAYYFY